MSAFLRVARRIEAAVRACARRDVTGHDAEAWFGIRPPRGARNVIPMRRAGGAL